MTSVNQQVSQQKPLDREKSSTRNEAPYAEVGIGKLRQNRGQNTRHRTALRGVNILTYREKYSYGASYRVRTHEFLFTLMRNTDVQQFIEISREKKTLFKTVKANARISVQRSKGLIKKHRFKIDISIKTIPR